MRVQPTYPRAKKPCARDGCKRMAKSRELCHAHFQQATRNGELMPKYAELSAAQVELMLVEAERRSLLMPWEREETCG